MWAVDAEKKMIYGIAMKKVRMRDSRVKKRECGIMTPHPDPDHYAFKAYHATMYQPISQFFRN